MQLVVRCPRGRQREDTHSKVRNALGFSARFLSQDTITVLTALFHDEDSETRHYLAKATVRDRAIPESTITASALP